MRPNSGERPTSPRPSSGEPARTRANLSATRRTRKGLRPARLVWPLVFVFLVVSDQVSKALAPRAVVYLDPGTGRLWPSFVFRAFQSPTDGGVLDILDACVLIALVTLVAKRARRPLSRAGTTVLFAGMSSNLLDRLGMDYLTQGVHGRFVVNWFDVGIWRVYVGNVADCCYVVGCALLLASVCTSLVARSTRLAPVLVLAGEAGPNRPANPGERRHPGRSLEAATSSPDRLRSA